MKYILHSVNRMNRGGMETYIMNLYRNIDRNKYQFHFAVHTNEPSDFDEEIKRLGGKLIVFPKFKKNPIKYRNIWSDFWKENKTEYHAFHYHNNFLANIMSIKTAINHGFKNIIIHAHSSFANRGNFQKVFNYIHERNQKYVLKNDITSVAVSEVAGEWVFGKKAMDSNRVAILKNGIDYSKFRFNSLKRTEIRKKLGLENDFVIGQVGNFIKVKNHKFTLEVFKNILDCKKNSKLLLLGDGTLRDDIISYAAELNISKNIKLLGNVSNVEDYLNVMDSFIFPSFYEGLPLSIIEAQINGLPVIYSDTITEEIVISKSTFALNIESDSKLWSEEIIRTQEFRNNNGVLNDKFEVANALKSIIDIYNSF